MNTLESFGKDCGRKFGMFYDLSFQNPETGKQGTMIRVVRRFKLDEKFIIQIEKIYRTCSTCHNYRLILCNIQTDRLRGESRERMFSSKNILELLIFIKERYDELEEIPLDFLQFEKFKKDFELIPLFRVETLDKYSLKFLAASQRLLHPIKGKHFDSNTLSIYLYLNARIDFAISVIEDFDQKYETVRNVLKLLKYQQSFYSQTIDLYSSKPEECWEKV